MAHDGFGAAILEDLHGSRPRVEIIGNGLLRIKCCGCEVRITGAGLTLAALSLDELAVTGTIVSVEYTTAG